MRGLLQDLRYALRLLGRAPGFTLTAILVLAVGIGANAAVFTVANALLFKPLGGRASGQLVGVFLRDGSRAGGFRPFSFAEFQLLHGGRTPFVSLAAQRMVPVGVRDGSFTRKAFAYVVSSDYFATLGSAPSMGRGFRVADEAAGAQPTVIVSHDYWRRVGTGASVLGRTVVINSQAFTVIGVAAEGFTGTVALLSPDFWIAAGAAQLLEAAPGSGAREDFTVVGRLSPGLRVQSAAPLTAPLTARLRQARPAENKDVQVVMGGLSRLSLSEGPRSDAETAVATLFLSAMAGIVLLIACLNLANMLLARGSGRAREVAIRLALGCGRWRLVRQLLAEASLLSLAGAAVGLLLAAGAGTLLARAVRSIVPFAVALDASPDLRILFATTAVTAAATLAFALGPALRLVRSDALAAVKAQAGQLAAGSGRLSWRNLLVVGQLAMSLALLTAAGLFVLGAIEARSATPGFPLEGGLVADVDLSLAGYSESRGRDACREAMARLRALPGVEAASVASSIPFGVEASFRGVRRIEQAGNQAPAWGGMVVIGADYFKTMKLSLLRGREFTLEEEERPSPVRPVIVDAAMARRLWPDADPIGRQIQVEDEGGKGEWASPMEVVGIVAGVRDSLFDRDPGPHVYVPFGSTYSPTLHLHLRAASSLSLAGAGMTDDVRREIRAADPALPILAVRTLTEHRDTSVYLWVARAAAQVFGAFGLAALVLATLGVYGVKAYLVARRTREIGIRVALGATRLDVLRLVLGDGCWLMTAGLLVGAALSLALSKVLASWVYGVEGIQLSVLFAAAVVLGAATLLASYLPARRATAMAPLAALRTE